jgi:hypothetical protein
VKRVLFASVKNYGIGMMAETNGNETDISTGLDFLDVNYKST